MFLKSINGWAFEDRSDWSKIARQVQQAGFEALEPTIGLAEALTPSTDEAVCRAMGDAIRATGLQVASLGCGLFWSANYASPDAADRQKAYDWTVAALERAAWLGAGALLVVPAVVGHFAEPKVMKCGYADALNYTHEALKNLAEVAETHGVVLAIENVWNQFLLSPVEMRELLDRVNSPWVGAYLDVGNVLKFGFPQDWIDTLGRRIARVHLKDFKLSVGTLAGFCALGDGDVDWAAVMAALKRVGYRGPLTFEGRGELADILQRLERVMGKA